MKSFDERLYIDKYLGKIRSGPEWLVAQLALA
jgi:hypothetical protein